MNCSSYFLKGFLPENSAWHGRFPSASFCRSVICAVFVCGMDTPRLAFPSALVATLKAIAQRQSQSTKSVCAARAQSRVLSYCGLNINSKVLTDRCCCECNERQRVQEEKCGLCALVIFTCRSGDPVGGSSEALTLWAGSKPRDSLLLVFPCRLGIFRNGPSLPPTARRVSEQSDTWEAHPLCHKIKHF